MATFNAFPFVGVFNEVFASGENFMTKVGMMDEVFDDYAEIEGLERNIF